MKKNKKSFEELIKINEELVKRIKNNDKSAINELYLTNKDSIHNACKEFFNKDEEIAKDVVQNTFLKIFSKIHTLKDDKKYMSWQKQITRNECKLYLRNMKKYIDKDKEKSFVTLLLDENISVEESINRSDFNFIPTEYLETFSKRQILYNIINKSLSDVQRKTLFFYFNDELKISEIAEFMECSEGTVKSRLSSAKKILKTEIEKFEEEEGIKIHVHPITTIPALTILFRYLAEDYPLSDEATEKIWNNIDKELNIENNNEDSETSEENNIDDNKASENTIPQENNVAQDLNNIEKSQNNSEITKESINPTKNNVVSNIKETAKNIVRNISSKAHNIIPAIQSASMSQIVTGVLIVGAIATTTTVGILATNGNENTDALAKSNLDTATTAVSLNKEINDDTKTVKLIETKTVETKTAETETAETQTVETEPVENNTESEIVEEINDNNDNDEGYSIEEEKEETSNNDNTTNNSNISNNGNSSNNSGNSSNNGGSSSNTKPTQPTKPSSVQPTIENVKSKVASLGWTYSKDDYEQYKCYKDGVSMGGLTIVEENQIEIALVVDSPSFRNDIQELLTYILPTGGNKIYNMVLDPFNDSTFEMDGKTVKVWNGYAAVCIDIYWP